MVTRNKLLFISLFLSLVTPLIKAQITAIPGSNSSANITAGTSTPPATCTPPAFYIRTSTAQTYSCTSTNTWTELSVGASNTYLSTLQTFKLARTSSTRLDLTSCATANPCVAYVNGVAYSFPDADIQTPIGSGTIYVYITAAHVLTVGHNITSVVCNNCTEVTSISAFPADSIPLYSWTVTTNAFDLTGGTDYRGYLSLTTYTGGFGITTSNHEHAVNTAVIVNYTSGTSAAPGTCTLGDVYIKTDTAQVYQCTTTNTYTELTGGGGSGDLTAIGDCTSGDCFTASGTGTAIVFKNATSGTITLQTVSGALGTITISLPAVTGTIPIAPSSLVSTGLLYATAASTVADAAGLTWDNTNKILETARSNSGSAGGIFRLRNSAALAAGNQTQLDFCTATATCAYDIRNVYGNADAAGATQYWALNDVGNSILPIVYTAINTRLYLGRNAHTNGNNIVTTGANAVIFRTSASIPFTRVNAGGASQGSSPYDLWVSNDGATEYAKLNATALWSRYNSTDLAGVGMSHIRAIYEPGAQAASVASGNLLATAPAGLYRVSGYIQTTTAPGAACTADVIIGWTYNSSAKTETVILNHDINTDENYSHFSIPILVDASANITRAITVSGTCGTYAYVPVLRLERY